MNKRLFVTFGSLALLTIACDKPAAPPPAPAPSPTVASTAAPTPKRFESLFEEGSKYSGDPFIEGNVAAIEEARVLAALFPKRLSDASACSSDTSTLAEARAKGQIVPSVTGAVEGAFTAPRREQKLYLVSVGECGAGHSDSFGSAVLAVMEGDRLVARGVYAGGSSLERAIDVDGDGTLEILLGAGSTNQGYTRASAELVRITAKGTIRVHDFGVISENNCGTLDEKKSAWDTPLEFSRAPLTFRKAKKRTSGC